MQEAPDILIGNIRENLLQMPVNSPVGFLRLAGVNRSAEIIPPELFGCRVFGDAPSVGLAMFILHIDKVTDHDIGLALQTYDLGIKAFAAVFAVIAAFF